MVKEENRYYVHSCLSKTDLISRSQSFQMNWCSITSAEKTNVTEMHKARKIYLGLFFLVWAFDEVVSYRSSKQNAEYLEFKTGKGR